MDASTAPRLILVDGNNYLYRAFYAIRDLANSRGVPTNAVYGFTTMLVKLLKTYAPPYMVVTFDRKGPTFRHEAFAAYKATRPAMPETLIPQIPVIKDIIHAFSIPILEMQGIEADDLIGTLARHHGNRGMDVLVVSGDKDLLQLVSERVKMIDTMKDVVYDVAAVKKRFGVEPEQVAELLGLMGDASDNLPGVPGVGPKHAQRLIEAYGSVEEVLRHVERIPNARLRESLRIYADQARLCRNLAVIRTDVEIDRDLERYRIGPPDQEALLRIFRECEFSSLIQEWKPQGGDREGFGVLIATPEQWSLWRERWARAGTLALEVIHTVDGPMDARALGLAFCCGSGETAYLSLGPSGEEADAPFGLSPALGEGARQELASVLADGATVKHGHDLKVALQALLRLGLPVQGIGCDTAVAAYLVHPTKRQYGLAAVALDVLGEDIPDEKDLIGSGARMLTWDAIPEEQRTTYACRRSDAIFRLQNQLARQMEADGLDALYEQVEKPLVSVLAAMELRGILLDRLLLERLATEMAGIMAGLEEKIYRMAGERFNIQSPKQLQQILFEKMGLPRGRKIKEGYSTDMDVLKGLARNHEFPAEILSYRTLAKLKSTYIDALPLLIHAETGRVHTCFHQTATATGRLSSSDPNLQNIPIRTPEGKRIRRAFIAPPGWALLSADYSQIELRVLAHLSQDPTLLETFAAGGDIHTRTAADVFGVFPELVTPELRRRAKVINFGILYGMSAFGLSQELSIPQKEAQAYIDNYFRRYDKVRRYLEDLLDAARRDGYVQTLLGRRRYLPDLNHPQATVRQFAERMAINAPIQGTAADIIKVAMVRIASRLAAEAFQAVMILQVHDELLFEAPEGEIASLADLVHGEMEGVLSLRVPLSADVRSGKNWDEAHS